MEGADVDYATLQGCLRDLARVNALSMGYRPTLRFLDDLCRQGRLPRGRALRVLDVGSGYGDMLRSVAAWADRHRVAVELTGLDLSPWSARAAREADPASPIRWLTGDVFQHDGGSDVVISALFTHHLDDAALVRFLRWSERHASCGWFVNDLHRHPLPHAAFGPLAAGLGLHRFVQHDGPVSFARSFRPADWAGYLRAAGIPKRGTRIARWFPFRLCVARIKPADA